MLVNEVFVILEPFPFLFVLSLPIQDIKELVHLIPKLLHLFLHLFVGALYLLVLPVQVIFHHVGHLLELLLLLLYLVGKVIGPLDGFYHLLLCDVQHNIHRPLRLFPHLVHQVCYLDLSIENTFLCFVLVLVSRLVDKLNIVRQPLEEMGLVRADELMDGQVVLNKLIQLLLVLLSQLVDSYLNFLGSFLSDPIVLLVTFFLGQEYEVYIVDIGLYLNDLCLKLGHLSVDEASDHVVCGLDFVF